MVLVQCAAEKNRRVDGSDQILGLDCTRVEILLKIYKRKTLGKRHDFRREIRHQTPRGFDRSAAQRQNGFRQMQPLNFQFLNLFADRREHVAALAFERMKAKQRRRFVQRAKNLQRRNRAPFAADHGRIRRSRRTERRAGPKRECPHAPDQVVVLAIANHMHGRFRRNLRHRQTREQHCGMSACGQKPRCIGREFSDGAVRVLKAKYRGGSFCAHGCPGPIPASTAIKPLQRLEMQTERMPIPSKRVNWKNGERSFTSTPHSAPLSRCRSEAEGAGRFGR